MSLPTHHPKARLPQSKHPGGLPDRPFSRSTVFWSSFAIATAAAIALPPAAWANSWPPMAVGLFHLPMFASLISFGWGLVAIVVLEVVTIARREKLSFWRVGYSVLGANLVSSITGIAFSFSLTSVPFLSYGDHVMRSLTVVLIGCLGLMGLSTHSALSQLTPWRVGSRWLWVLFWPLNLVIALVIIGIINAPLPIALKILSAFIYFMMGWFMSWAIEGACLAKWLPNPSPHLGQSIAIANLRSYAYLVVPLTLAIYFHAITKTI